MIHFAIPWDTGKNIGAAYNRTMEIVHEDDWVCFVDGDALMCSTYFGKQIEAVVANNSFDLYSCMTNRVSSYQADRTRKDLWDSDNIRRHRKEATIRWEEHGHRCEDVSKNTKKISGVIILLPKRTWLRVGPFMDGMLGVDNDYHRRVVEGGGSVGLMRGIYVYHWYRGGNIRDIGHLKN